jgi:hypothetical protein
VCDPSVAALNTRFDQQLIETKNATLNVRSVRSRCHEQTSDSGSEIREDNDNLASELVRPIGTGLREEHTEDLVERREVRSLNRDQRSTGRPRTTARWLKREVVRRPVAPF